jgi:hypothetical protein
VGGGGRLRFRPPRGAFPPTAGDPTVGDPTAGDPTPDAAWDRVPQKCPAREAGRAALPDVRFVLSDEAAHTHFERALVTVR